MIELLLLFKFWQWAVFVGFLFLITSCAHMETTVLAFIGLLFFIVINWLVFDANPLAWLIDNPAKFLMIIAVYLAVGALWSLFKWSRRMASDSMLGKLKEAKKKFINDGIDGRFIDSYRFPSEAHPSKNKERIISWISLWPFL